MGIVDRCDAYRDRTPRVPRSRGGLACERCRRRSWSERRCGREARRRARIRRLRGFLRSSEVVLGP